MATLEQLRHMQCCNTNIHWSTLVITTRLLNGHRENWNLCVQLDQIDDMTSCYGDEHSVDMAPASSCSSRGTRPCMPHTSKPIQTITVLATV